MRVYALLIGVIFAAALAYDSLRMPVQVFDSVELILAAQESPSVGQSFADGLKAGGFLRPLHLAEIKALFEVSGGQPWWAYRGFHAFLIVALILLFVHSLRVRTGAQLAAAVFALTVLMGLHTIPGVLKEAYPVSHYLLVPVSALAVLNLAQTRPHWLADIAATLTFAVALLNIESGVLVWIVAVTAWLAGWRGISRGGLAGMTVVLASYLVVRFVSCQPVCRRLTSGAPATCSRGSIRRN